MKKVHDFSEVLIEESLAESADTFFGKRKNLEDQITVFKHKCKELQLIRDDVVTWEHGLGFLLLKGDAAEAFYKKIGVVSDDTTLRQGCCWGVELVPPRSWLDIFLSGSVLFGRSRYWKTVYAVYSKLYELRELYEHGRYYNDPSRPGGKKQTINCTVLEAWGKRLNAEITSTNENNQPSQVLQFVKQFQGNEEMKERIAGAGLEYTLDNELAFPLLDLKVCGLVHFPELPAPESVKGAIRCFCRQLYDAHKETIVEIMAEVEKQ